MDGFVKDTWTAGFVINIGWPVKAKFNMVNEIFKFGDVAVDGAIAGNGDITVFLFNVADKINDIVSNHWFSPLEKENSSAQTIEIIDLLAEFRKRRFSHFPFGNIDVAIGTTKITFTGDADGD